MTNAMNIAKWQKTGGALPYKKRLEYIESTGTQYIDTGIVAAYSQSTSVKLRVAVTRLSGASNTTYALMGANSTWNGGFSLGQDGISATEGIRGTYGVMAVTNYVPTVGAPFDCELSKGLCIAGNRSRTFSASSSGFVSGTILLFGLRRGTTVQSVTLSYCRMYSAQFYQNGALVADFIPVLDWDDNPTMFDEVTQTYPTRYGTFVAGPEA